MFLISVYVSEHKLGIRCVYVIFQQHKIETILPKSRVWLTFYKLY